MSALLKDQDESMCTKASSTGELDAFEIESYFAKYEFNTKYLLCCSDAESMKMKDLLKVADEECLHMWDELWMGYTECWGLPALRQECVNQFYPGLCADNIRMFAGAEEGIYCAMTALLSADDHAVVLTPCYQSLLSLPKSRCSITAVDLSSTECWQVDLAALRAAIRPDTKLIVMNWPHNPTGHVPSRSTWDAIIDIARESNLWIFSDEVYRGLEVDENHRLPTLASVYEKGLSLGVLSKSLGLAGLRVGWIACSDQVILNKIADIKHYLSICNSGPSEILALIALRNNALLLERIREIARDNLQLIDVFLQKWGTKFRWNRPIGGCCGFMQLVDLSVPLDIVAKELVEKFGVLIIPGSVFCPGGGFDNFFRIGFGRVNFPECFSAFDEAVQSILGHP